MKKFSKSNYDDVIKFITKEVTAFPQYLKPICIVQNGHINHPGISDIDLLIGFKDDFFFAQEFISRFKSSLEKLNNKEIYFPHLPFLYPISLLKKIPDMTYNPIEKLKVVYGKSPFNNNSFLSLEQNILNSFDQLHNRIVMMAELLFLKDANIKKVMLLGHSLLLSLNSINKIGADFKKKDFYEFLFIEKLRKESNNTGIVKNISDKRYREICKNLCSEFYRILIWLYSYLDRKICAHFSYSGDFHKYSDSITFNDLYADRNNKLKISLTDNKIYISGFSWKLKCIFENYFLSEKEFITILMDENLKNAIKNRAKFINTLSEFNFKNFGNAYGRGGLSPLVKGSVYDTYGMKTLEKK